VRLPREGLQSPQVGSSSGPRRLVCGKVTRGTIGHQRTAGRRPALRRPSAAVEIRGCVVAAGVGDRGRMDDLDGVPRTVVR